MTQRNHLVVQQICLPLNFFVQACTAAFSAHSNLLYDGDKYARLTHTLLQRTLYSKGTLCIVTSCSKEQFASNWHVTVCSLTHFTPQHTLPPGMFFSSAQFASQHPLLPKTPCSSTHFASQHTLLLRTLCSSAHFASKNTLLLGTLYSSTHFAS